MITQGLCKFCIKSNYYWHRPNGAHGLGIMWSVVQRWAPPPPHAWWNRDGELRVGIAVFSAMCLFGLDFVVFQIKTKVKKLSLNVAQEFDFILVIMNQIWLIFETFYWYTYIFWPYKLQYLLCDINFILILLRRNALKLYSLLNGKEFVIYFRLLTSITPSTECIVEK